MIHITYPHPIVLASCIAALLLGFIIRWVMEECGIDLDEKIRQLFGRR